MPRWICIRNKPLLRGAVVVLTRQLSAQAAEAALAPLVAPTGDVGDVPAQASDPATSDRHGFARTFTSPKLVKMPRAHHTRMTLAVEGELFSVKLPRKRKAAALEAAAAGGGTGLSPSAPDPASSAGFVAPSRVATARSDESSKVRWHPSYVRSFAARGGELRENDYPISGDGHLAATYLPAALPMDGLDASAVKASPGGVPRRMLPRAFSPSIARWCSCVARRWSMVAGRLSSSLHAWLWWTRRAARSSTSSSSPSDLSSIT